jgi:hypothetical protein
MQTRVTSQAQKEWTLTTWGRTTFVQEFFFKCLKWPCHCKWGTFIGILVVSEWACQCMSMYNDQQKV